MNKLNPKQNLMLNRNLILPMICWQIQVMRLWPNYAERSS